MITETFDTIINFKKTFAPTAGAHRAVQEKALALGYEWPDIHNAIRDVDFPFFYFENGKIIAGFTYGTFINDDCEYMPVEEFLSL